ncbi:MAG: hypothetical protein Q8R00_03170 [Candidatus Nanoarchaeia archaeon]|nr:hypothetical protein [Candidatus Nanoarchaeia archaeon]
MTLIQELNRIKNSIGLVSGTLKLNEYDDTDKNVSAHIDPRNWSIELNINRGFNPITDRRQKAYARKKKIEDGKKQLLTDILHHELGHWELPFHSGFGCPYDVYNHDLILEAVKEALPEDKQGQAGYVANAFEDLINNTRCKEYTGNFSGQVLFWDDEGFQCKRAGQKGYTPFYEAFVKLNMHLWGDNSDKALLKRHNTKEIEQAVKVEEAVNKVVKELSLDKVDTVKLFNKSEWPEMASQFAAALAPLLEIPPTERLSAYQNGEKEQEGNGLEEKASAKEGKEEITYGRYKSGDGLSPNFESHEQLDLLYKRLARSIPVEVEAMTREQSLAIAPLNFRAFDPETDDVRKIKSKLYANDEGVTFGHQRTPLTIAQKAKFQRKSFPDFKMVVLDNSGTMKEGINGHQGDQTFIPWGDNSKYHYALLGFYGIEQFLQAQGIAQYIGHGLALFSSSTRYEESDFKNIHQLRKLALSPDWGGTKLDARTLVDALQGRESFVLSISDGEIENWSSAKSEFEKLAKENYFAHIQIGGSNRFTQDLEGMGLPVFYVSSGEELSKLMVNTATNTYKRFTKQ